MVQVSIKLRQDDPVCITLLPSGELEFSQKDVKIVAPKELLSHDIWWAECRSVVLDSISFDRRDTESGIVFRYVYSETVARGFCILMQGEHSIIIANPMQLDHLPG